MRNVQGQVWGSRERQEIPAGVGLQASAPQLPRAKRRASSGDRDGK